MDFLGDVIDGKYEILRVAGEGGMGTVYEARHRGLDRLVAVKLLHLHLASSDSALARFEREARLAASLRHDHIVDVTDVGVGPGGVPYIVMELLAGHDLQHVLRSGRLGPGRAVHILVQALAAVDAAHDKGIVHRDLKPENIFLCDDRAHPDWVKLLDFGIAKPSRGPAVELGPKTTIGATLGTPHYMSPEQAAGAETITHASDIYSLGVVLYQMLTGALPFAAANYNALMVAILNGEPPVSGAFGPDVAPELAEAVSIAMARDPARRFASARDFEEHVRPFARAPVARAGAPAPTDRPVAGAAPAAARYSSDCNAIFLGVSLESPRVTTAEGEALRVLHLSDPQQLQEALAVVTPRVMVTAIPLDFEAIADRFPVFHASVIQVNVAEAGRELVIREWSAEHGAFLVSRQELAAFDTELSRLCAAPRPACIRREVIASQGAGSSVEAGGCRFEVQTEVAPHPSIEITTTVWQQGVMLGRRAQPFEPTGADVLADLNQALSAQHGAVVAALEAGQPWS